MGTRREKDQAGGAKPQVNPVRFLCYGVASLVSHQFKRAVSGALDRLLLDDIQPTQSVGQKQMTINSFSEGVWSKQAFACLPRLSVKLPACCDVTFSVCAGSGSLSCFFCFFLGAFLLALIENSSDFVTCEPVRKSQPAASG